MLKFIAAVVLVLSAVGCSKIEPKTLSFTEQACSRNEASRRVQGNGVYAVYANPNLGTGCLTKIEDDSVQVIWRSGVEVFRSSEAIETPAWKVGSEVARAYSLELLPRNQEFVTKVK